MSEAPSAQKPAPRPHSRVSAALRALVRARITAGLLLVLPIWITYHAIKFVFTIMRDSSQWAVLGLLRNRWIQEHVWKLNIQEGATFDVDAFLRGNPSVYWLIAIISVFLTAALLYAIGLFAANVIGRRIIEKLELLLDRVPVVKTIYRLVKQVLDTFAGDQKKNFQRVAMFPFLAPGVYSIGFITRVFQDPRTGEEYVSIFYATTPNPTTGFVFVLRRADVVELDWSVEDAVKSIISGGVLLPDRVPIPENPNWRGMVAPPGTVMPPAQMPGA